MGNVVKKATDAVGLTDSGKAGELAGQAAGVNREMAKRLAAIDLPDVEKQRIALEMPELVGLLETEELSPSEFEQIVEDQRLRKDQMSALDTLRQRSEEGFTEKDKLQQEEMLGDIAAQEMAQRASIEQQMARQGKDSSGASLIAKLQGQQNLANQGREQALKNAAQSQANKLAAAQSLAQQAGNVRGQDYSVARDKASASDIISRANAQNRQDIASKNLGLRQNIANQRVDMANQQQMFNKGLQQQDFQNKMSKASGQNQVSTNQANMYMGQSQAAAQADAQMMSGLMNLAGSAAMKSDKNAKKDIENGSPAVNDFLDKLKPYMYNYKDEEIENEDMEEPQLSVMAQDLEKSELGREFVEEDENDTKRVDYNKMAPAQLAALAELHQIGRAHV